LLHFEEGRWFIRPAAFFLCAERFVANLMGGAERLGVHPCLIVQSKAGAM
jgi:hypothetical protein